MRPARRTHPQRRSDAAPLALVLAGWVLAVVPIAHPLLAHGTPFLRDSADEGWVHHGDGHRRGKGPAVPAGHHHAPGAPEHLQVQLLATAPPAPFQTVVLAFRSPPPRPGAIRSLPRRWSEEQPQAP
ncbi:MAG TPA: hypothetical protein VMT11_18945 [Myxococcaceae bacterium]|nr:hypothetical protein [Myxococcaceae bacterium]